MIHEGFCPELILWDLDGTLVDSSEDLVRATNEAMRTLGYPDVDKEHFARMVGNGVRYLVGAALPAETRDLEREKAIDIFMDYYKAHIADRTRYFQGIPELLLELPVVHAIVSNKREDLCRRLVDALDSGDWFGEIVGGDTFLNRKPHPQPVSEMVKRFSADPSRTIMIGDSILDIESGFKAGVKTVGVTWGFGDPLEKPEIRPDYVFSSVSEMADFLRKACLGKV
jgi:phosphoglycolate phosphatase